MSAWTPGDQSRRAHPELAQLAVLDHQLLLLAAVLADVHSPGRRPEEQRDQARSLSRVAQVLRAQITAYRRLLELPEGRGGPRRPG